MASIAFALMVPSIAAMSELADKLLAPLEMWTLAMLSKLPSLSLLSAETVPTSLVADTATEMMMMMTISL